MTEHTQEPWRRAQHSISLIIVDDGTPVVLDTRPDVKRVDFDRIVACVNACTGMADPAAEIARLRANVEKYRTALYAMHKAQNARRDPAIYPEGAEDQ